VSAGSFILRDMRAWAIAITICLASAAPGIRPAAAQPDKETKEAAERAWNTAQEALKKSDWAIAQREFGRAYELTKDPVFFYWIALSHEKGGNCTAATIYYKRFLKEGKPSDADRKRTQDYIAKCEADTGAGKTGTGAGPDADTGGGKTGTGDTGGGKTGTGTGDTGGGTTGGGDTGTGGGATGGGNAGHPIGDDDDDGGGVVTPGGASGLGGGPPTTVDTKPTWKWTAAWISVGGTIAFATAGAVLGLSAKSRQEDIENLIQYRGQDGRPAQYDGEIPQRYKDLIDEGQKLDKLSKISFAVAGGAAAAAVLFFVLDATSSKHPDESSAARHRLRLTPTVANDGVGLSLGWEL